MQADNCLFFMQGSKLTWCLSWGCKLTWFCVRAENKFVLVWGSIALVFCVGGRNRLGFGVRAEITWF